MKLHLLHPMAIHFGLALVVVSFVFELLALYGKETLRENFAITAKWNLYVGHFAVAAVVLTGYFSKRSLEVGKDITGVLNLHEILGYVAIGLVCVAFFWRKDPRYYNEMRMVYLVLLGAAVVVLLYGAFLGGELVYEHGLGITGPN